MTSSLCCCSPCRPAYKRHVDAIYPEVPEAGLVKSKMEALVYYAMTSPEKLDRIGEYLAQKVGRDIYRNRKELVFIGSEAIDQILSACHVRIINLFIESYLKTIQRLLESPDPDFQILASNSFMNFSKIKEETPVYYRTYDFFIDRFSQMCHSDSTAIDDVTGRMVKDRLRIAGLQGISGVIRKSVNEDLAENIWEARHMEKILPSLLFNLEDGRGGGGGLSGGVSGGRITPDLGADLNGTGSGGAGGAGGALTLSASQLADQILRELVQAATSISIKAILSPVLRHMDNHHQWDVNRQDYAVHTFNAIMYSIQVDLSYILIETVIAHLDTAGNTITQKGNIATVLSKIIHIGVGESTVGPAVLEIITSLLRHLTNSVEAGYSLEEHSSSSEPMLHFQGALFRCLGEYTGKMPDFQKSENMSFILSKIPMDHDHQGGGGGGVGGGRGGRQDGGSGGGGGVRSVSEVQLILMKALIAVAEKHNATLFSSNVFNAHLLRLLTVNDPNVRMLVLQTFQILADRNDNMGKLQAPHTLTPADLDLYGIPGRKNRTDHAFAQKTLFRIYAGFKQVLAEHSNSKEFLEAMYATVAILAIELSANDEATMCLLDLIDGIQTAAVNELALSTNNRFNLHSLAVLLFAMLAMIVNIPDIDIYLDDVVKVRKAKAAHMLPPIAESYNPGLDPNTPDNDVLIDVEQVKEALKNAGKDVEPSLPILGGGNGVGGPGGVGGQTAGSLRPLWQDYAPTHTSRRSSTVSMGSLNVDQMVDSAASSPGFGRRLLLQEDLSVKTLKRILEGIPATVKEEQANKRKEVQTKYLFSTWDELCLGEQQMQMNGHAYDQQQQQKSKPDLLDLQEDLFNRLSFGGGGSIADENPVPPFDSATNNKQQQQQKFTSIMADNQPFGRYFPEIYLY